MHKRIKPFVAGAIGIAQAEAVAAVLVEVELYGAACFVPGFDHAVINCVRIKDTIRRVADPTLSLLRILSMARGTGSSERRIPPVC